MIKDANTSQSLICLTSFHLCKLERIIPILPAIPDNALCIADGWTLVINTIRCATKHLLNHQPPG